MIATVTAAFAALSVTGIVLLTAGHRAQRSEAAGNSGKSAHLSTLPSQDGSGRAPGSSGPPPDPSSVGQVTVTAAASQDENASSVATFLDSYFNAINTRDYPSYISMLSPQAQQGLTAEQFDSGYRSTVDSAETLVSISVVTNGDLVAAVTFTSHQNPVDSPDRRQSCTDWNISLFLEQDGRGYLIDRSPPGYLLFCLKFLPGVQWERRSIGIRLLAGGSAAVALGLVIAFYLAIALLNAVGHTVPVNGPLATSGRGVFIAVAFLALAGSALVGYSYSMYRTFSERLRPGAEAGRSDRSEEEIEARIAEVEAAQRGNVTLYAGENPFIGTGVVGEAWSIAIELDRAPEPGQANAWRARKSRGYVPIDPVELHQVIRARLLKLRDDELPENERISALSVHHHVVGDGHCRWDSPVIDPARTMPYSEAGPEAIDALIRHPAAGLRYYQRVCVSDEGQAVWARQREVIGGTDQEVAVSAFIHAAVEGRMFYLEFVPVTMPPIQQRYHLVDRLPKITSGRFLVKVVLHAAGTSFRDTIGAPFRVIGAIWRTRTERRSFREEAASAKDYIYADIGAQVSVREIRAASSPRTFL